MGEREEIGELLHRLEDKQEREQNSLDRAVFLVSAGLIIVFVNYLGAFNGEVLGPIWMIRLALFLAIEAIATQIIAYLVSTNLNHYAMDIANGTKQVKSAQKTKNRVAKQNLAITTLNIAASLTVLFALIFSAYFVSQDLELRNSGEAGEDLVEKMIEV